MNAPWLGAFNTSPHRSPLALVAGPCRPDGDLFHPVPLRRVHAQQVLDEEVVALADAVAIAVVAGSTLGPGASAAQTGTEAEEQVRSLMARGEIPGLSIATVASAPSPGTACLGSSTPSRASR
jgi:hypothetical protein